MADEERGKYEMRRLFGKKSKAKTVQPVHTGPNCHDWATKMEVSRIMSGKSDLVIKEGPKQDG
jgi:hypothetical protein